jgi:hypothetical protein
VIVLAHVALGAMGYSKLMRYVILATPASVLLAAWAAARIAGEDSGPPIAPPFRRTVLAALLIAGLAHEGAQGVVSSVVERFDLIKPVYFGLPIAMPPGTRAPSVRP